MKAHIVCVCVQVCLAKGFEGQRGEGFGIIDNTTLILPRNTFSGCRLKTSCHSLGLLQEGHDSVAQSCSPYSFSLIPQLWNLIFSHFKQRKQGS